MLKFLTLSLCLVSPILAQLCPEPYGVQTYPHETYCDKFHLVSTQNTLSIFRYTRLTIDFISPFRLCYSANVILCTEKILFVQPTKPKMAQTETPMFDSTLEKILIILSSKESMNRLRKSKILVFSISIICLSFVIFSKKFFQLYMVALREKANSGLNLIKLLGANFGRLDLLS